MRVGYHDHDPVAGDVVVETFLFRTQFAMSISNKQTNAGGWNDIASTYLPSSEHLFFRSRSTGRKFFSPRPSRINVRRLLSKATSSHNSHLHHLVPDSFAPLPLSVSSDSSCIKTTSEIQLPLVTPPDTIDARPRNYLTCVNRQRGFPEAVAQGWLDLAISIANRSLSARFVGCERLRSAVYVYCQVVTSAARGKSVELWLPP